LGAKTKIRPHYLTKMRMQAIQSNEAIPKYKLSNRTARLPVIEH